MGNEIMAENAAAEKELISKLRNLCYNYCL